jgi:hypothetical protein
MINLSAIKEHLVTAITTAAVLGGGSTLIGLKINDARQDEQIEAAAQMLPQIQKDVKETHDAVIRLEAQREK